MAELQWDAVGDRKYQAGLDRGVLYLGDTVVPWNGLTGVDDATPSSAKPFYIDGVKYFNFIQLGEFEGTLKALTYPDEFEAVQGVVQDPASGIYYHDQAHQTFSLSYRTLLGNDVAGLDLGYEIHMLYNLHAIPQGLSYTTLGGSVAPREFSWGLTSTPKILPGRRPTAHLSIKSTAVSPANLALLEELLYGSSTYEPMIPDPTDVVDVVTGGGSTQDLHIVDNGDGTWTAEGSLRQVRMTASGEWQIDNVDATIVDEDTYEIPTG